MTKLSRKNTFRTVASPGAYECMAVCNWRSSSLYGSKFYNCPFHCVRV